MKNSYIFMAFAGGALIGYILGCRLAKKKYEQLASEEIRQAIQEIQDRNKANSDEDEGESENSRIEKPKTTIKEYAKMVTDNGYLQESKKETRTPYVIPPEQFGELDYEEISLYYHFDGSITDAETGIEIEDVVDLLGDDDISTHFGEYEAKSVYIRDDESERDYEILLTSN